MSDLVAFEDLIDLDSADLRAVFKQVTEQQALAALAATTPGIRQRLLSKLGAAIGSHLESGLATLEPVTVETAQRSQRALIDALRHLSRGGLIAFDDPDDMVA